jgi:hypothetical protein
MGGMRNAYKILIGKPEWKTPHRIPNVRMDLRDIGWEGMEWMQLAQD